MPDTEIVEKCISRAPSFFAELYAVYHTADVDILDIRAVAEMLNISGAVEYCIYRLILEFFEMLVIGNVALYNFYTAVEYILEAVAEVVEHHILQALGGCIEFALTEHTVGNTVLAVEIFRYEVRAHKACRACNKHVSELSQFAVFKRIGVVLFEQLVDFCIIVIVEIERSAVLFYLAVLEQLGERSRGWCT